MKEKSTIIILVFSGFLGLALLNVSLYFVLASFEFGWLSSGLILLVVTATWFFLVVAAVPTVWKRDFLFFLQDNSRSGYDPLGAQVSNLPKRFERPIYKTPIEARAVQPIDDLYSCFTTRTVVTEPRSCLQYNTSNNTTGGENYQQLSHRMGGILEASSSSKNGKLPVVGLPLFQESTNHKDPGELELTSAVGISLPDLMEALHEKGSRLHELVRNSMKRIDLLDEFMKDRIHLIDAEVIHNVFFARRIVSTLERRLESIKNSVNCLQVETLLKAINLIDSDLVLPTDSINALLDSRTIPAIPPANWAPELERLLSVAENKMMRFMRKLRSSNLQ